VFIAMITPECAPVAQAGGLGEVVLGLSREMTVRGHFVDIILPKYDGMRYDLIEHLSVAFDNLPVPWYSGTIPVTVWTGLVHGRRCFFIDPHSQDRFFARPCLYGYDDDVMRFAFFSKAALEFLLRSDRRPDVIHCHDWQTGLVPVLLYDMYQQIGLHDQRACYTIHNFAHQGVTDAEVLWATGLARPEHYFHPDRLLDPGNARSINLMKGGIVYANAVTTVSPQHAWEARHTEQGHGLGHTLNVHAGKFQGVLNGIDYDVWNPEIDGFIPERYTTEFIDLKYGNKKILRDRFWLRQDYKPLIAYVGRLDRQKGVHLIRHALRRSLDLGAQFVLLGTSPEPRLQREFEQLKGELNENPDCHIELGFSPELAHLIYAGADMAVVPSLFEPCGLAQLIALKYGTVPIVRHIGGLVDTVHDREHSGCPPNECNGFVFHQPDERGLDSALSRAIGLWNAYPGEFRQLMLQGMAQDHSWAGPGWSYVQIFDHIRHK
jgi:starch synthase